MCRALSGVFLFVLSASTAWADDLTVLPDQLEDGPKQQMVSRYLKSLADTAFERRREAYELMETPEDCEAYQARLKELFLEQLGPLPEGTPLNARVTGELSGDGYRVEKLIYESQPRHYVTAALFLPEAEPPYPAVLVPCGHSRDGKVSNQRVCILLAKNGTAALCYDPIGQGERFQLLDKDGEPRFGSTDEHTLLGATCMLVGRNTASYRIWDGMRSIDYLCSRSDIDAAKIGVTGVSGGGTMTSYLMALDDRVACAAPSCYLTSYPRLLATIGPQDAEQNIHAQIALGIDHADYVLLRAPRPTLILASTRDFFDIEGTWDTFRQAKRFYTRLGFAERVEILETDAEHGYPKLQREAMVRWMVRWLSGRDEYITEPEFAVHSAAELQCTPQGQVMLMEGARSVMDLNVELNERLQVAREQLWTEDRREEALQAVRRVAGIRPLDELPQCEVRSVGTVTREHYTIDKLVLQPEDGIALPALLFKPTGPIAGKCLYLQGDGKHVDAGEDGRIHGMVIDGNLVLAIDLRGCGETGSGGEHRWGGDWDDIFLSYLLGKSMLGMRTEDVLQAARMLSQMVVPSEAADLNKIHLVCVGTAQPPAVHAAALERDLFKTLQLVDAVQPWSDYLHDPVDGGKLVHAVHGALGVYDLPDLLGSLPEGVVVGP